MFAPDATTREAAPPASRSVAHAGRVSAGVLRTEVLGGWVAELATLDVDVDDAERIDQLRILEEIKAACAAAQARVTKSFAESQRAAQRASGVPSRDIGKGIGAQVALARRDSRFKGGRHLGLAEALVDEMPNTMAALEEGRISEWRATLVARETACLARDDRTYVDAELSEQLERLGDKQTAAEARKLTYARDPRAFMARVRGAESDRRVTIRPAPDTMSLVTGFLPVGQGVAVHAALTRAADSKKAQGDARSRGQIMADEFVARITGQSSAGAVPVEISLVMTDAALLAGDDEPAHVDGYGPIPAELARELATSSEAATWLRRLFTRPDARTLLSMDSRRRIFPDGMKRFARTRDQVCRTPWCDAPIRHSDHVEAVNEGGTTTIGNVQGLCEACDYTKAATGWSSTVIDDQTIEITTPTGHCYRSRPPPLPGAPPERPGSQQSSPLSSESRLETRFRELIEAAA